MKLGQILVSKRRPPAYQSECEFMSTPVCARVRACMLVCVSVFLLGIS